MEVVKFVIILILVNVIHSLPLIRSGASRDEIIRTYFKNGFSYTEIIHFLAMYHGITLSLRHLNRLLRQKGLYRKIMKSPLISVIRFIQNQLMGSGSCTGYRSMYNKLRENGYVVDHETVRLIIKTLDPDGVDLRTSHRLIRRQYLSNGPNETWHIDGYDKLKPFGFPIHGAADGYSRKVLWLNVGSTNNNPKVIAQYFIDTIKEQEFISPRLVRTDRGSENVTLAGIQRFLRRNGNDSLSGHNSFRYGSSTRNQRIESWWSILRRSQMNWWIDFFHDFCENSTFDPSIMYHMECIRFCFMGIIQSELDEVKRLWNNHRIRRVRNSTCPSGRPNVLYHAPAISGGRQCGYVIDRNDVLLTERFCEKDLLFGCSTEMVELCLLIMKQNNLDMPTSAAEAGELFRRLIVEIEA